MKNEDRIQVTIWVTPKEKTRIRKTVAWLNGTASDSIRQALVNQGPKKHTIVSNHSLAYHGLMQLVESCEEMQEGG